MSDLSWEDEEPYLFSTHADNSAGKCCMNCVLVASMEKHGWKSCMQILQP